MKTRTRNQATQTGSAFSELLTTLKEFPAPVWFIFLGTFLNRFGTFVIPFLALHMGRLGYSAREAGLAIAAYGAGHLAASVVGGHLADTMGRRNTIVLSMFSGAASMLALSRADSLIAFILLAGLVGMTGEFYRPASSALLTDLTPEDKRVTAFAAYRFAINAGWAIGPAVAGLMARHSYQWLFFGDAATSIIYGIIAWKTLPVLRRGERGDIKEIGSAILSIRTAVVAALSNPVFRRFMLASLATALVFMQMHTSFGLEVKAAGYSTEVYGMLLALNGVLIVLFEIPIAALVQRRDAKRVIACGFAIIGIGMGGLAFADTAVGYSVGMTIFTFGEMISMPVAMALVSRISPPDMRGRYMGVYGLTWAIAMTIGPAAGMALFAISPVALWLACGILGISGAVIAMTIHEPGTAPETEELNGNAAAKQLG